MSDPTPIFEIFRGNHATEILTAAVSHLGLFERLAPAPLSRAALASVLGLADRPTVVLTTALRAMGLLTTTPDDRFTLTDLAQAYLLPNSPRSIHGYIGLAAESPGVRDFVERLRTNRPVGAADEKGAAFIYRDGIESAMEQEASARQLTLALAGRARNVAPILAERYPLFGARRLMDVGGGTGLYAQAWLLRHPELTAVVWDRPEVLRVATEMAQTAGVANRLACQTGDMFVDPFPESCDTILLSNILHDWDVPECRSLVKRCAMALPPGGTLLIHDVFLNDALDGPLPQALYSAALFSLTEGRAYSAAEYREWLTEAGLLPGEVIPTLIHCGVLPAIKSPNSMSV